MVSARWKSIVVAVGNPDAKSHVAIDKAREIARRCKARVTLLHVFSLPYPLPRSGAISAKTLVARSRAHWQHRLAELAKPLAKSGLKVDCRAEWDYPIHDGVVRHVLRSKPDLLIAESHHHGKIARWFLSNTDWELIRACPCPLWFVKTPTLARSPKLLAAVDPSRAFAKPKQMDSRIVEAAQTAAAQLGGETLLAHVFDVQPTIITAPALEAVPIPPSREQIRAAEEDARRKVAALGRQFRVKPSQQRVAMGVPSDEIQRLVNRHAADVLVMGAVSRRGMRRVLIGSTAERMIDPIRCDVLIVKPRGFKPSISRRRLSFPEGI